MLKKASKEDVVVECTNLYDHFFVQPDQCRANVTAARLPYFDGDYWPGAAEDLIRQMSQEDGGTNLNRRGLTTKKNISKRSLRAIGQLDLSVNASKDRLMMQKVTSHSVNAFSCFHLLLMFYLSVPFCVAW